MSAAPFGVASVVTGPMSVGAWCSAAVDELLAVSDIMRCVKTVQ
jgi:hypothetical protein